MRVFIPATFGMLHELAEHNKFHVRGGVAFTVTAKLRTDFADVEADEEELEHYAFQDAAMASMRLLTAGDPYFSSRRVVISADVPEVWATVDVDAGDTVVRLKPAEVEFDQIAAIHVDLAEYEELTAAGVAHIDAADLGDEEAENHVFTALENFMAWYDPLELGILTALSADS